MKTALLVGLLSVSSLGAYEIPYGQIRTACVKYLDVYATAKDMKSMEKRLMSQVETKVSDQGVDEDRAMREVMLDWAASNAKKLDDGDRKSMVQACFYFVTFIDKGYAIPGQIRERLTSQNVQGLLDYLDSAVKRFNRSK